MVSTAIGIAVAAAATCLFPVFLNLPFFHVRPLLQHPLDTIVLFVAFPASTEMGRELGNAVALLPLYWFYVPLGVALGLLARRLPSSSGSLVGTLVRSAGAGILLGVLLLAFATCVALWRGDGRPGLNEVLSLAAWYGRIVVPYCAMWLLGVGLVELRWRRSRREA
jgi:hypothetical protein